jgi:hypothetical protein
MFSRRSVLRGLGAIAALAGYRQPVPALPAPPPVPVLPVVPPGPAAMWGRDLGGVWHRIGRALEIPHVEGGKCLLQFNVERTMTITEWEVRKPSGEWLIRGTDRDMDTANLPAGGVVAINVGVDDEWNETTKGVYSRAVADAIQSA